MMNTRGYIQFWAAVFLAALILGSCAPSDQLLDTEVPAVIPPTLTATETMTDTPTSTVTPSATPTLSSTLTPLPLGNAVFLEEGKNFIPDEYSSESDCISDVDLSRPADRAFTLKYDIPSSNPTDDCYAGFDMDLFPQPFDVTDYKALEFTIVLSDAGATCVVILADTNEQEQSYLMLRALMIAAIQNGQTVTIPLDYFSRSINLSSLSKITFEVTGVLSTGNHSYTISDVKLTK